MKISVFEINIAIIRKYYTSAQQIINKRKKKADLFIDSICASNCDVANI